MSTRQLPYFLVLSVLAIAGCAAQVEPRTKTLVLDYGEFGPQIRACELLGFEYYQWDTQGPDDPRESVGPKVVVYRDISLEEVKQMYPVDERNLRDYRYLEYKVAIGYLNRYKDEPYLEVLEQTKKKIIGNLGS